MICRRTEQLVVLTLTLAFLAACSASQSEDQQAPSPKRVPAREQPVEIDSSAQPMAPKAPHPVLRFTFRLQGHESISVMSTMEADAEVVFEAREGETGEILRSQPLSGRENAPNYCEVRTDSGQGWVPEELLGDVHWDAGGPGVEEPREGVPTQRVIATIEEQREDAVDPIVPTSRVADTLTVHPAGSGEPFDMAALAVSGQYTIVDFYSEHCGPCRRLSPQLESVAAGHSRVVLRKVDVDRPGSPGIDWGSPIVQQYGIQSLPHVVLYDTDGSLIGEDAAARERIDELSRQR